MSTDTQSQSASGSPGDDAPRRAARELSPLRASIRGKSGRSSANRMLGIVLVTVMLAGFALAIPLLSAPPPPAVERSRDVQSSRVGSITLAPDGEHCRRMALDNKTGRMEEVGRVRCVGVGAGSAHPEDVMRERYSGGRLEVIRKSFSER